MRDSVIVKNIIAINVVLFIASAVVPYTLGISLTQLLSLHYPFSDSFNPVQLVTHMFMHGGLWHIAFNMYGLYLFGTILERIWGPQRFLIFYTICGLGAAALYLIAWMVEVHLTYGDFMQPIPGIMLGASGAVYGILLGFAMLFPNTELMLLFPPIPIKAKYLVAILFVMELYLQFQSFSGDNVAHLAHLGGMLFAFIMVKLWSKDRNHFY